MSGPVKNVVAPPSWQHDEQQEVDPRREVVADRHKFCDPARIGRSSTYSPKGTRWRLCRSSAEPVIGSMTNAPLYHCPPAVCAVLDPRWNRSASGPSPPAPARPRERARVLVALHRPWRVASGQRIPGQPRGRNGRRSLLQLERIPGPSPRIPFIARDVGLHECPRGRQSEGVRS